MASKVKLSTGEAQAMKRALAKRFPVTVASTKAFTMPEGPPSAVSREQQKIRGRAISSHQKEMKKPTPKPKARGKGLAKKAKAQAPKLQGARPKIAIEKYLARSKAGAGVIRRVAGTVARRALPGVATGLQVGAAIGGRKAMTQGAIAGGIVSAIVPRLVARIALPVAAAAGAADIARAGKQAYGSYKAQKHVKVHAAAAKKAGAKVTRTSPLAGMITGKANIKVTQTEEGRKTGEAYYRKRRQERKRPSFEQQDARRGL